MRIPRLQVKYRGKNFLGDSIEDLRNNINKYFRDRNVGIDSDEVDILLSKNVKKNGEGGKLDSGDKLNKVHKGRISFKSAVSGAKALLRNFVGDIVDKEEIKRRSSICSACKENIETTDCVACGFGGKLNSYINSLKQSFGGNEIKLSQSVKGRYCGVCNCALALMLPSKMDAFTESDDKQKSRPNHCWVKQTSSNYVPN